MKMFRVILCFFIILTFTSCGKNELMDLSGFIHNYNFISDSDLSLTDFIIQKDADIKYTAVLTDSGHNILISLCQGSDNKIKYCKIAFVKEDSKVPTIEETAEFCNVIIDAMTAYCNFDIQTSQTLADNFHLSGTKTLTNNGELTLSKDNFYFVYYSTDMISQFTIYNTYIQKIEPTEKPVSKPYFGEDFVVKDKETP